MNQEIPEIETAPERIEERRRERFLERIRRTRISFKKLAVWILVAIIIFAAFSHLERKYPLPEKDVGFKWGYKTPDAYVMIFMYDFEQGLNFVDEGDRCYSDIDVYILPKRNMTVNITVAFFEKRIINETEELVPVTSITKIVNVSFFELKKVSITMPRIDKLLVATLYLNGYKVVTFYYRFNIYYQKVTTILGEVFVTQIIYMFVAIIIYIIALIVARSIANVTPTPQADLGKAALCMILFGLILYYVLKTVIFEYGLYQAFYFYPLLFVIALFSALFVISPEPKYILMLRTNLENTNVEAFTLVCRIIKNRIFEVPTLMEFLFYKPKEIVIDRRDRMFRGVGSFDYIIYFKDIDDNESDMYVEMADIHMLRVEDYKSNMEKIYAMSETIEKQKERIKQLEVEKIVRAGEEAVDLLKRLMKLPEVEE